MELSCLVPLRNNRFFDKHPMMAFFAPSFFQLFVNFVSFLSTFFNYLLRFKFQIDVIATAGEAWRNSRSSIELRPVDRRRELPLIDG